jgi:hypothetical protein
MGVWQKNRQNIVFWGKTGYEGVKSSDSADFTIKNVPLQTILCGFVKVRLNNF